MVNNEDLMKQGTGLRIDPQEYLVRKAANAVLEDQQRQIIEKMAGAGVDLARSADAVRVDLVTLKHAPVEGCRRCRFLPMVAKRERAEYLSSLEGYLRDPTTRFARYGVVTLGSPITAMDRKARGVIQAFHRKLSRWSAQAKKKFSIEVIIRATEFTRRSLRRRGLAGDAASYHFHANVIYVPSRYDERNFADFLSWTHKFFGSHWADAGKIRNLREIVKYMVKPGELDDATGEELVWLFKATQKLKIIQALGGFAGYRRSLKDAGLKIRGVTGASGEREMVFLQGDTRAPSSKEEKRMDLELERAKLTAQLEAARTDRIAERIEKLLRACEDAIAELEAPPKNMVIALLPPAARDVNYLTPSVMVAGFTNIEALSVDPKFRMLRGQALAHWQANGAPPLEDVYLKLEEAAEAFRIASNSQKPSLRKTRNGDHSRRRPRHKSPVILTSGGRRPAGTSISNAVQA